MSSLAFCPRGGMQGIKVTQKELEEYAQKNGLRFIDEVIPLPDGNGPKCADSDHTKCGTVVQWG